ncbi:AI-2E family transporter [Candidatus Uhrbacteria bacterium]|nr:AI-2E family transporter [Candidatus Uhrbacteria bacterium]
MPTPASHMTIEKWFFLLVMGAVMYLFWKIIQPFALVLLLGAVVAIILSPIETRLRKLIKNSKLSAGIMTFGVLLLVFIPLLILLILMARQASDLIQLSIEDHSWIDQLKPSTSPVFALLPSQVQEQLLTIDLTAVGSSVASWAFQNIGGLFSSSTKFILNAFLFFLCLYYLLVDRDRVYKEILLLSPLENKIDASILKRVVGTVRSVVFGVLLVAIIQGVFAGIGMTIFHVPGALIWGGLTILAALVPLVGTAVVLVPAILFLFFTGSTGAAFGLLLWSLIFVSMADNIIGPYLIGNSTHMHAFLVLLSVLGGLSAFGAVGGIAGPTILAALLALIELYKSGILTSHRS